MIDLTEFESRAVPLRALGVVVSQNGMQLARKLWDDACRRNVYSASKSFTSMAVGIAQKEGLLSIDEKLTDAFKDDLPEIVSDNLKAATVRDLLTMCLGQEKSFLMGGERPYYEDRNWVRLALRQPFVYAPGEKFVYNNVGPYLAGILVQRTVRPSVQADCSSPLTNCTCSVSYCCKTANGTASSSSPPSGSKKRPQNRSKTAARVTATSSGQAPRVPSAPTANTASSSF